VIDPGSDPRRRDCLRRRDHRGPDPTGRPGDARPTTIIIAHRLSTIALADGVDARGRPCGARGTQAELLTTSPVYREIHEHGLLRAC
jgi:ABC-type multidrug transport system fused ATPase/permease subunit